jgi:uncharacterized membrane protein YoaK (UPF0700 family)
VPRGPNRFRRAIAGDRVNAKATFILAAIAGFADTATYLKLSGLFAAHVTGNFVLLALAINRGWGPEEVVKITAFGVFALGAILTTVCYDTLLAREAAATQKRWLLAVEGTMLLVAAGLGSSGNTTLLRVCGLVVVFAMSMQNVFHRTVPDAPMASTVMTLNFTQSMVELVRRVLTPTSAAAHPPTRPFIAPSWFAVAGFMGGCAFGAVSVFHLGLSALLFPSLSLFGMALWLGAPPAKAG